jgi:DNA-nicking Smr family endonuclease
MHLARDLVPVFAGPVHAVACVCVMHGSARLACTLALYVRVGAWVSRRAIYLSILHADRGHSCDARAHVLLRYARGMHRAESAAELALS